MNKIPNIKEEKKLWAKGYKKIAGVDESGCGSWAGPVVAAAVILPPFSRPYKIRDCKLLSKKQRECLYEKIKREALAVSLSFVEVSEINKLGIRQASILAMEHALNKLKIKPEFILVDAFKLNISLPQKAIIKGDMISLSIASASIVAKVERDKIMGKIHQKYPFYFFNQHKGYGTILHQKMLKKYGPCKIHRRNFTPIKKLLMTNN